MKMASFYTVISLLIFLTSLSLIPYSTNAVTPIEEVCPKTTNPPFCFQALNSDPNAPHATKSIGIANPAINCAQSTTGPTMQVLDNLISVTNYPHCKDLYDRCLPLLDNTERYVVASRNAWVEGKYGRVSYWGGWASTSMKECDQLFERPLVEPAQLEQHCKDVQDSSDVVKIVGDMLDHPL